MVSFLADDKLQELHNTALSKADQPMMQALFEAATETPAGHRLGMNDCQSVISLTDVKRSTRLSEPMRWELISLLDNAKSTYYRILSNQAGILSAEVDNNPGDALLKQELESYRLQIDSYLKSAAYWQSTIKFHSLQREWLKLLLYKDSILDLEMYDKADSYLNGLNVNTANEILLNEHTPAEEAKVVQAWLDTEARRLALSVSDADTERRRNRRNEKASNFARKRQMDIANAERKSKNFIAQHCQDRLR